MDREDSFETRIKLVLIEEVGDGHLVVNHVEGFTSQDDLLVFSPNTVKRGAITILNIDPAARTLYIDGPLPVGICSGDYLVSVLVPTAIRKAALEQAHG